jgi:hypothetical protein
MRCEPRTVGQLSTAPANDWQWRTAFDVHRDSSSVAFEEKHADECPALIEMVTYMRAGGKVPGIGFCEMARPSATASAIRMCSEFSVSEVFKLYG